MAKVKVITRFKDACLHTPTFYEVGQEVEFDDEVRVRDIVSRGLVEVIEEPKVAPEAEVAAPAETETLEAVNSPKPKGRPKAKSE